jgi:hypothetical protein
VLETAGFADEARLADEYDGDGEYLDVHWYPVFADER